jgi:putative Holliday junction resolvase
MRALSIDYGKKRVGIAISDEEGQMAFPHSVIENDGDLARLSQKIFEICQQNSVDTVVIGESKDFDGQENPIMREIRNSADSFKKISNIEPIFMPELLSSHQASKIKNEIDMTGKAGSNIRISGKDSKNREQNSKLDASAAAIILQSYLDKTKYQR